MVVKQSAGADGSKKAAPKNQNWMDEFLANPENHGAGVEDISEALSSEEENFAELFEASQLNQEIKEGEVVDGTVVSVGDEYVTVDIGYKCEGLVYTQEFKDAQGTPHVAVGDVVSVYLERMEAENGFMLL